MESWPQFWSQSESTISDCTEKDPRTNTHTNKIKKRERDKKRERNVIVTLQNRSIIDKFGAFLTQRFTSVLVLIDQNKNTLLMHNIFFSNAQRKTGDLDTN